MDVRLQPRARRLVRTALFVVSRGGFWWVLAVVLLSTDPPVTAPVLVRLMLALVVLPGLAAALLRGHTTHASIEERTLLLGREQPRLEIPCQAIAALKPSVLPFPDLGLEIVLRSGRRVVPGIEVDDPVPLLTALAEAGAPAETALRHPSVVVAAARQRARQRLWDHPLLKFGLFAFFPAAILFNAHQHISYGGFWGEYYALGARAWLGTLAWYYVATLIYCVLYASVWRGVAEGLAFVAAAVAPTRAAWVRRLVEAACRIGYFAGVPLLLLVRFLP